MQVGVTKPSSLSKSLNVKAFVTFLKQTKCKPE